MPERGFNYFPSLSAGSTDAALAAHELQYCTIAVVQWPEWRRHAEQTGVLSTQRCDAVEAHAITQYREFATAITAALPPLSIALWPASPELGARLVRAVHSHPWLVQRIICAHAFAALYADPEALPIYRQAIAPQLQATRQHEFNVALSSAKWDVRDKSPGRVLNEILRQMKRELRRAKAKERARWVPEEMLHTLEGPSMENPESSVIASVDWERGREKLELTTDQQRAVEARRDGISLRGADAPKYFGWTPKHLDSIRRSLEPNRHPGDRLRAFFEGYQNLPNRAGSRKYIRGK
jgi:hypothetical protein